MGRVDIHHHHTPPAYAAAVMARRIAGPVRRWSPELSLADMDSGGVETAILSITAPAVRFVPARFARWLARECNDATATIVRESDGRFGMLAVLPLPDVDGTLGEIEHALGVLGADGVGVLSSYGGRWLGDRMFEPVLEELDRRRAVVFVHPATPARATLVPGVPASAVEWPTETARTIASLVLTGAAGRHRDIRFVFAHGGGTVPILVERLARAVAARPDVARLYPDGAEGALRRFRYDLAQASHPSALSALGTFVKPSQLLFGSDFPYRTSAEHAAALAAHGFDAPALSAIARENALELLPRLRGTVAQEPNAPSH